VGATAAEIRAAARATVVSVLDALREAEDVPGRVADEDLPGAVGRLSPGDERLSAESAPLSVPTARPTTVVRAPQTARDGW
jgi:hypothetical protein